MATCDNPKHMDQSHPDMQGRTTGTKEPDPKNRTMPMDLKSKGHK